MDNAVQPVIDKLMTFIKAEGDDVSPLVLTVPAPMKVSVLMADGKYKTVPLAGGEELILVGVRGGKRDDFIFEFEPADSRPYTRVEMPDRLAMKTFEEFEPTMVSALGADPATTTFGRAKGVLLRAAKKDLSQRQDMERQLEIANRMHNSEWGIF